MKKIEVLGPGCPKCSKLAEETQIVAGEIGLECHIEKVTDMQKITGYGVMMTPALVVDGVVKSVGKVPSRDEIKEMLS
jgi:small redox-active disulfide protein 2